MWTKKAQVLIVGGGAAGLSCAWHLKKKIAPQTLLITQPLSNSFLSPWNLMIKDKQALKKEMLEAGCFMNKRELIDVFLDNIPSIIKELKKIGLRFKKSNIGLVPDYPLPGKKAIEIFLQKVKRKGIKVLIGKVEKFLLDEKGKIVGTEVKRKKQRFRVFFNYLVLAGGGIGGMFKYTTGASTNDGSLLALALESGLTLENLEFFMFHPFLICDPRFPKVLISGELLTQMEYENEKGQAILSEKVATALRTGQFHHIFPEMVKEFYLASLKNKKIYGRLVCSKEWFERFKKENEFGWVFRNFTKEQIKKIEIHPAFHFLIGGLSINKKGQTSQKNVYAAGEIAGGLHGANRIGGLAILEALVFGRQIAFDINQKCQKEKPVLVPKNVKPVGQLGVSAKIKELAWRALGPVKNDKTLKKFYQLLKRKKQKTSQEKLLQTIVQISLSRKESVGAFIKEGAPKVRRARPSFVIKKKIVFK